MGLNRVIPTLEEARGWYTQADAVHDFDHIIRVYRLALRLAQAEGADLPVVQAAALLHDVRGSAPGSVQREIHHLLSSEAAAGILREHGWNDMDIQRVQHCIRAHRFRDESEQPQTIEARVIYDADKLDVLGAVGIVRTVAYSVLTNEPVYAEPSDFFLQSGREEANEPHSSYHEYLFKLSQVKARLLTVTGRQIAEDRDRYMADFFKRLRQEMTGKI